MAEKMVSLKMSAKEAKSEFSVEGPSKPDLPKYPYDTRITLSTDTLEKLGISVTDYKVGEKIELHAKAEVVATEHRKGQSGERSEIRLQITDLGFGENKKAKKAKAESEHLGKIGDAGHSDED